MLDGEIVCLDKTGTSQFTNLLFRRGEPRYYAFDLLSCNGEDLRYLPLADRKHKLHSLVPTNGERRCTVITLRAWVRSCSILSASAISKV